MKLTEMLSSEHRVIEQVMAALDAAADRLDAGKAMRPGFFEDATRFIVEFSDGCHHAKEERVLFPALTRHGVPAETGPVAVMLYEHEEGRRLTAGLRDAAARLAARQAGAADVVADYARAYAALLAQHIFKEDNILFPLASRVIPAHEWDDRGRGRARGARGKRRRPRALRRARAQALRGGGRRSGRASATRRRNALPRALILVSEPEVQKQKERMKSAVRRDGRPIAYPVIR
jgi:hemerythrin-like domain-containing protein